MLKILLICLTFTMSIASVMACPSQIVILPDGRMMVCYYCNNGKLMTCENL